MKYDCFLTPGTPAPETRPPARTDAEPSSPDGTFLIGAERRGATRDRRWPIGMLGWEGCRGAPETDDLILKQRWDENPKLDYTHGYMNK